MAATAGPSRRRTWLRLAHVTGYGISLAAIAYVAWQVRPHLDAFAVFFGNTGDRLTVATLAVCYGLLLLILSFAWLTLLRPADSHVLSTGTALSIYCRAQMLKYLPSNALHLVGRHAAARQRGSSHGALIWAAVAETALMIAAAGTVALLLLASPKGAQALDVSRHGSIVAIIAAGILVAAGAAYGVWRARRAAALHLQSRVLTLAALGSFALYLLFFTLNGMLLLTLVHRTTAAPTEPLALVGLVAAAWVLGFVTPGAPAGLGVREVILIHGLELLGLGAMAAPVALAYRLVTTGGDLLCGIAALLLGRLVREPAPTL